jgi:hypothetical protein
MTPTIHTIVALLQGPHPDVNHISDLVYHADKSLGKTYIRIRSALNELSPSDQKHAYTNFRQVINQLNSPSLFIDDAL